jgi:hypothetical protein
MAQYYDLRDNDGHMYRVPASMVEEFKKLRDDVISVKPRSDAWYDLHAEFDNKFGHLMFE